MASIYSQHQLLHAAWPDDCALCRAEQTIAELEAKVKELDIRKVTEPSPIGIKIRQRREELSITQNQLGRAVGWDRSNISAVENGRYKHKFSKATISRLCEVLRVPKSFFEGY